MWRSTKMAMNGLDPLATEEPESPPSKETKSKRGLGQALKNPGVRILGVLSLVAVIILVMVVGFLKMNARRKLSVAPPVIPQTPSAQHQIGQTDTPEYKKKMDAYNKEQERISQKNGGIYLPLPTQAFSGKTSNAQNQFGQTPQPPVVTAYDQQIALQKERERQQEEISRIKSYQKEANRIMTYWNARNSDQITTYLPYEPKKKTPERAKPVLASDSNSRTIHPGGKKNVKMMINRGDVFYGVTLNKGNTDVPGPILIQMTNGPLAGARLMGTLKRVHSFMVINPDTATIHKHSIPIDALVIDSKTGLDGVRTSVNHHYFERYGLVAAAGFLQGMGEAFMMNGTTTVTGLGNMSVNQQTANSAGMMGLGQMGQTIGNDFQGLTNTPTTVKVKDGTPVGVLFMKDVPQIEGITKKKDLLNPNPS